MLSLGHRSRARRIVELGVEAAMRFFLIDKITEWNVGTHAAGIKNVTMSEDFFNDHFPKYPVMPGVLILEALAQLSGLLLEASVEKETGRKIKALLSLVERAKFRQVARPGDTLELASRILSLHEEAGKVAVIARAAGTTIAESEMMFVWTTLDDPVLEAQRRRMLEFWMRDIRPAG
jgi:3-hydroxyacyl-[acyl-carrier-protein] dehydratase